jgi:hypothetical protein
MKLTDRQKEILKEKNPVPFCAKPHACPKCHKRRVLFVRDRNHAGHHRGSRFFNIRGHGRRPRNGWAIARRPVCRQCYAERYALEWVIPFIASSACIGVASPFVSHMPRLSKSQIDSLTHEMTTLSVGEMFSKFITPILQSKKGGENKS